MASVEVVSLDTIIIIGALEEGMAATEAVMAVALGADTAGATGAMEDTVMEAPASEDQDTEAPASEDQDMEAPAMATVA